LKFLELAIDNPILRDKAFPNPFTAFHQTWQDDRYVLKRLLACLQLAVKTFIIVAAQRVIFDNSQVKFIRNQKKSIKFVRIIL